MGYFRQHLSDSAASDVAAPVSVDQYVYAPPSATIRCCCTT
jgi:hypothetical protein